MTTCEICGTTRNETLTEHLAEHHLNEMLDIETDPRSGVSVIHGRAPTFDGGWVRAPKGQPKLAIVHAGEYVLPPDRLR